MSCLICYQCIKGIRLTVPPQTINIDNINSIAKLLHFTVKGSQTRESTIQNQEEGPPVTNSQTAPPIPVPAIIKVGIFSK